MCVCVCARACVCFALSFSYRGSSRSIGLGADTRTNWDATQSEYTMNLLWESAPGQKPSATGKDSQ